MRLQRGDTISQVNAGLDYELQKALGHKLWQVLDSDGTSGLYALKSGKQVIRLVARDLDRFLTVPEYPDFQGYIQVVSVEREGGFLL